MRKSIEKALKKKMNRGGQCYMGGGEVMGAAGGGDFTDADFADGSSVMGEKMGGDSTSSEDISGKKKKDSKSGSGFFKFPAPSGYKPMVPGMAKGGIVEDVAKMRRARKVRGLGIADHLKKKMGYK